MPGSASANETTLLSVIVESALLASLDIAHHDLVGLQWEKLSSSYNQGRLTAETEKHLTDRARS